MGEWAWREDGAAVQIDDGVWLLDVGFQGRAGVVAAFLLAGDGELALIETGPSSTLPALAAGVRQAGFALEDVTHLLLTHIHLDHAGAAGPLARARPEARVYVHPFGAPHLIDPAKLIASATRIYGDQMEPLWGEFAPIAAAQVVALDDDQPLRIAGRTLRAIFTPGHASHHVVYWDEAEGALYTGDVGGIRMPGTDYVCPPTPPPDLDPAAWAASVERMRTLGARRLCPTHFGVFDDAPAHLARLIPELHRFVELGEASLAAGEEQATLTARIHDRMVTRIGDVPAEMIVNLEWATPSYMATLGLTRYLTKRS